MSLKSDSARDNQQLSVDEKVFSSLFAENPSGIWQIALAEPLALNQSSENQLRHVLRHGFLAEQNPIFAQFQCDGVAAVLFDDAENFWQAFAAANYRLINYKCHRRQPDGAECRLTSDIFGVSRDNQLHKIWGMERPFDDAHTAAEAANRLKDEILSVVSHELRTPLTAIAGWTQVLLGGKVDADVMQRGLEIINRNAASQERLIETIVDVSHILTNRLRIEKQLISVPHVIAAAAAAIEPTAAAKSIRLTADTAQITAPLFADARRIQQVVSILLTNAVKFTPKNGAITIAARTDNDAVEITVSDTGIGIKAEILPGIFDRLRPSNDAPTAHKSSGLGLGLAIARHIVELHGGSIQAKSGEHAGAVFTVRLPEQPII